MDGNIANIRAFGGVWGLRAAAATADAGILPGHGALQSGGDPLKNSGPRKRRNMKTRWFTKAAITALVLCSASGLLYAQDNGDAPVPVTRNVWSGV
jgi:hypothetical protein